MSEHTPGPWYVGVLEDAANVCYVGSLEVSTEGVDPLEYDVSADARLIAAAPELLEALEKCTHVLPLGEEYDLAVSVIGKAKGEQG